MLIFPKIVKCPNCGIDITDNLFEIDSKVSGHINIGYDCNDCKIEVYTFYVEKLEEDEEELDDNW